MRARHFHAWAEWQRRTGSWFRVCLCGAVDVWHDTGSRKLVRLPLHPAEVRQ